ncbi:MAG: hypothetical protein ACRDHP_15190, partial [Ktedonobacterales bacterium]
MMIDVLKQAVERAAKRPEGEQAAIAYAILDMLDAGAKWEMLLSDSRTPEVFDELWAEVQEGVRVGRAEDMTGDRSLSIRSMLC